MIILTNNKLMKGCLDMKKNSEIFCLLKVEVDKWVGYLGAKN
jgi:hypothetical protein